MFSRPEKGNCTFCACQMCQWGSNLWLYCVLGQCLFFSRTSQQPAKEYIFTYKFWKTHLCWTQWIQILTRTSSDSCLFDSDKCVGAEFCPRGRGQGAGEWTKTPEQKGGRRKCSCETPRTSTVLYKTLPPSKKYWSHGESCAPRTSVSSQAGRVSKEDVPETTTVGPKWERKKSPVWGADAPDPPEQVASLSTAPAADKFTSPRPTRGLTSKHGAGRKTVGDWSIGGRVRREKELRGGRATLCAALLFCG